MANIELVIKIPEEMYKWVNEVNKFSDDYGISDFIDLVKNGTLLPKGHGRLIDADVLKTAFPCGESVRTECVRATIDYAPTIIEADKESEDKE